MKTFVFRYIYELARSVERFLYLFQFVADDLEEGIMEGVMINNLINVIHLLKMLKVLVYTEKLSNIRDVR